MPDSNSNDDDVFGASLETPNTRARVFSLLSQAYPEKAGAAMEILIEQCIITGGEWADSIVPDAATLAVVDTLSQKRRKPWIAFAAYMQSIVRNQAEKLKLEKQTDPARYQYTRLVGPEPHGMPGREEVRRWNDDLLEWRREGPRYWIGRRKNSHPRMLARAVELGMWTDTVETGV